AVWFEAQRRAAREAAVSDAEVRRATEEVEMAFGYVNHYSDEAASIVRDDVMDRRVLPSIEHALTTSGDAAINDALVPELKRAVRESGLGVTSRPPKRS
ncbi:MAG TPA: hypothetical protein VFH88_12510, partial [Candidatus Krumholzibacteria bacterium]|nr:hypothetical protein [Candidatus Krumholzibacteria bacterium]